MPLTRVSLRRGKPAVYRRAILEGLYEAMRETFGVPEDDRFMIVTEHEPEDLIYGAHYLGVARSDDIVMVQLTVSDTRSPAQKRALFARIVERLGRDPGVRPEDVLISLVEVKPENWSLGLGRAQYAEAADASPEAVSRATALAQR